MDKSPDAFRTISEVADVLETPAHVLRFWETRFPQIRPVKRAGGRRYYRPADVALLTGIKRLLHDDGLTIRGVQKILREHGVRHVATMGMGEDDFRSRLADPLDIVDDFAAPDVVETAAIEPFSRDDLAAAAPPDAQRPVPPEPADLWPDAKLPPPDDDGTLALRQQTPATGDLAAGAVSPAPSTDVPLIDADDARLLAALAEVVNVSAELPDDPSVTGPVEADAGAGSGPVSADHDDMLLASVLGVAAPPAPVMPGAAARMDDGWRSLPLAPGEEMPLATRLRALPQGALAQRSAAVAAWVARARDLTHRMNRPEPVVRD